MTINPLLLDLPMPIVTPRLQLVPWHPDHTDKFNAARNDSLDHLQPWMKWATAPATLDETRESLTHGYAKFILRQSLNMIGLTHDGEFVLSTGLHNIDWDIPSAEIGYWCCRRFLGQGYVTEAANALLHYGFSVMGMRRMAISMDSENHASRAIAERLNLILESTSRGTIRTLHQGDLRARLTYVCFDSTSTPSLDVRW
jgi:ribosomal-protein-serine acetyltransferase